MKYSRALSYVLLSAVLIVVLLIAGCGGGGGGATVSGSGTIPATTKVLDASTLAKIATISADQSAIVFSGTTAQLNNVKPGDIIASDVTPSTPEGMLRKVTAIQSTANGTTTVLTSAATLEEAVQKGSFSLKKEFSTTDVVSAKTLAKGVSVAALEISPGALSVSLDKVVIYDADENESTTGDQITASGTVSFRPIVEINGDIDGATLKQFYFSVTGEETSDITVRAAVPIPGLDKRKLIKEFDLGTQTIWIGYFPIVTSYKLGLYIGVTGDISLGISANANQNATITGGVKYENGAWAPVSDYKYEDGFQPPTVDASASLKCYAGPEFSMKFYGVAGPYANFHGYLLLEANPLSTPWWELFAGMEANAGAKIELLSGKISARYEAKILDRKESLTRAPGAYVKKGTISGSVKDAVSGSPLSGVSITIASQGDAVSTATTDSNGLYSLPIPVGDGYTATFIKTGYITTNYNDIAVDADSTRYLEAVLQIDVAHSGNGTVTGKVINAFDGSAISGVTIKFRQGINATTGTVAATATSLISGTYSIANLAAGNYTGEASKPGYNTAYFTATCIGGTTTANQNASMTMFLASGLTRIILTWGATPADLDSHLTGPLADGSRFHMYYPSATSRGGSPWPSYVKLDLDDVTSYGPETTTIYQQLSGTYRFSIHDFSNAGTFPSYALSNSNAKVVVQRGSSIIATYYVPARSGGTLWTVFEMNGNSITPINRMSYESDESRVQKNVAGLNASTDAALIRTLPAK